MQSSHSLKQNSPVLVLSLMVFGLSLAMCLLFTEGQASKKQALNLNLNSWQTISGQNRRYMNSPLSYEVVANSAPKHSILELLSPNSPVIIKIHIPAIHAPRSNTTKKIISKLDTFSQNLFANISYQTTGAWVSSLASNQNILEQDTITDYNLIKTFNKVANNKIVPVTGLYLEEQGQRIFNSLAVNTNGAFLNNLQPLNKLSTPDLYAIRTAITCAQNCGQVLGVSDRQNLISIKQTLSSNVELLTDMLLGRFDTNTKTLLLEAENAAAKKEQSSSLVQN